MRWVAAPVKTPADLFTQELHGREAPAPALALSIVPTVFNHVLGTKFRIVAGLQAAPTDTVLAMERGEVQGGVRLVWSIPHLRAAHHATASSVFLLRAEELPIAEIPDVPSIFDYAKSEEQRQLMRFVFSSTEFGRPYVFPPEVPKDRVELCARPLPRRCGIPAARSEAASMKIDMTYRPPDQLERLVANLYETPPAMIETVKKLVPNTQ